MRRHTRRCAALLGLALLLGAARSGGAQAFRDRPPAGPAGGVDLNRVTHEMAERVRHLGEDIASDLGATPEGRHLIQDTQELALAVDEFHDHLHDSDDPFRLRRAYSGIDSAWHHLKAQLARQSSPAINRAARHVDALDTQIHQALGLGTLPTDYYAPGPAADTFPEIQRLARTLEDRAQYLAAVVRADMAADPNAVELIRQAADLARASRIFTASIDPDVRPDIIANSFSPVATVADQLERRLTVGGMPPRVAQAWQNFASAEILLRQTLGLPTPPPAVQVPLRPAEGPSPLIGLTDELVGRIDAFLEAFTPTAGTVPEGGTILADAQRLRAEAAEFRNAVARGIDPARLAAGFRGVDLAWNRMARRINRVARGRVGPNIQNAMEMGGTLAQIHQLLGMPGYPPEFADPAGAATPYR